MVQRHPPAAAPTSAADRAEGRRSMCTAFLFWKACRSKGCRRARGCAGRDPDACFERWWPHLPEEFKVQFRAFMTALKQGLPRADALKAAATETARWRALQGQR